MKLTVRILFIIILFQATFLHGCREEGSYPTTPPANDEIATITFYLQRIDSARYWGDSEKIRLTTALIRLFPEYQTYEKRFLGTADETIDPSRADWSKESSGRYSFSADSTYLILDHDPRQISYFPGKDHTPSRLEQHDSVWYAISFYFMAVSGKFCYAAVPMP